MLKANSQQIIALFHMMLDALLNGEAGLFGIPLVSVDHHKQYQFTLPQLFICFSQVDNELAKLSYAEFRKVLFNSPINEEMKKRGGEIAILENTGKVDKSVYCLKLVGVNLC